MSELAKFQEAAISLPSLLPLQAAPQDESQVVSYLQSLHNYLAQDRAKVVRALNVLSFYRLLMEDETAFPEPEGSGTVMVDSAAHKLFYDRDTDERADAEWRQIGTDAGIVDTDTTDFDEELTGADDTVQKALDTLDDHEHAEGLGPLDYIDFDLTYADGVAEGRLQWNIEDGVLEVGLPGGDVNLQIGQEMLIRCRNTTGVQIDNGSVVYQTGASGNKPLIALADASTFATSLVVGIATEDIAHNENGYVTVSGLVRDVNTLGMTSGNLLWLSPTAGEYTETRPEAPDLNVLVGAVIAVHATEGVIYARPINVHRLATLSDVYKGDPPSDGDSPIWDAGDSRFEMKSPTVSYGSEVCLASYVDKKERNAEYNLHGGLDSLDTGSALDSVPTDIVVTAGTGKILIVVNAGADVTGTITVTGTTVDRNTGVETGADTDTVRVGGLTTDGSDTDASGNVRHSFTDAYITSKWFKGSVTLSTTNLTLSDVDTYQVSFEQFNDAPDVTLETFDITALATNASAWLYAYLYTVETGIQVEFDSCNITRLATLDLPAAEVSANKYYRLRRGNLDTDIVGTTDGIWVDLFPGPLASVYWEDVNIKVWARINENAVVTWS